MSIQDSPKIINSQKAPQPVGAYPHARRAGNFVYLSGVGPRKPVTNDIPGLVKDNEGNIVSYDIDLETRSVIENIKNILISANVTLNHVVDVQVYLTNMKSDFQVFNKIYAEYFANIQATRTTIEVESLPTPIHVEMKVVAYDGN
jgi:2-aminomuconate deaminase